MNPQGAKPPRETHHSLILRAWEAVNSERHLQGVLAALSDILVPVVPFAGLAIIHLEGVKHELFALHVPGVTPIDEGEDNRLRILRMSQEFQAGLGFSGLPDKPVRPYSELISARNPDAGLAHICNDLLAEPAWFEHERALFAGGVRAYCSIPMFVRGALLGTSVYSRATADPFLSWQVDLLAEMAKVLGVAVANAVANEEIRRLREQLEAENIALREQLGQAPWFEEVAGDSPALRRVLQAAEQVAGTDATVLLTGETGTGKEIIARAIHRRSPRAHAPLVKVNCAAIPENLLASELFGHERGAFTGAVERRKGRFEQAHGATLFLDEIGEMPMETQVLLLRVLQEREFERLGGSQTVRVDVRLIAATNRNLLEDVWAGRFRSDLYFRLNVFPIHMPPLRERIQDLPLLVARFAARYGERFNRPITRIDKRALATLSSYSWPGNVRELENVVERAVVLARNGTLTVDRELLQSAERIPDHPLDVELGRKEREAIEAALRATRGKISGPDGAAKRLGLPASTLDFRIRRLGIDKYRFRAGE